MNEGKKVALWLWSEFQQREQLGSLNSSAGMCPMCVHKSGEAIMAEEELSKERIIGKVGVEGAEHILLSL